ncbi:integrative conjugal element protein [Mycoplasma feriruminatoris]|uniref:Integrative conjugal element protein n=1 Tax=Mycoplasma feriruminatoris TaxID=1179777 RepID=A0A654IIQ6_9MOLU|nr:hypothetical protein [Mycoplasma feriruminatoris]WFQ93858.1 integrative conjugal element protein [Mycoplasma feriruminatoris]VZR97362.1 hypothetical protein MF5295_00275 [Mycoplasma feriruminatoris]VZR99901.1 hypothetical protein MF5582_00321 [Mycoplasma feriruminatoris]
MENKKSDFEATISNSLEDDFGMGLEERVAKRNSTHSKKSDLAREFINTSFISKNVQLEQNIFSNKPKPVKVKRSSLYMNERVEQLYQKLVYNYIEKRGKAPSITDIFVEGLYSLQNKLDNE